MFNSFLKSLYMAKHHSCRGFTAHLMPDSMHIEPIICKDLASRNRFTNPIDKNLTATARQTPKTSVLQFAQYLLQRHSIKLAEEMNFGWAKCMNIDTGVVRFDGAEQIKIPTPGKVWVKSALHQYLVTTQFYCFFDLLKNYVCIKNVSFCIIDLSIKRTEVADRRADVRIIDIPVYIIGPERFGVHAFTDSISGFTNLVKPALTH